MAFAGPYMPPGGFVQGGLNPVTQPMMMSFRPQGTMGDIDPITPGIQTQPGIVTATGPSTLVSGGTSFGLGLGMPAISASRLSGVGFQTLNPSLVDADPITPGIQTRPGVVTAVGPPTIVSNSGMIGGALGGRITNSVTSGYPTGSGMIGSTGFIGGMGISSQQQVGGMLSSGVISGPPQMLVPGLGAALTSDINNSVGGGIVDYDPITPGIQSQPGILTLNGSLNRGSSGYSNFPIPAGGVVDYDPITPGIQSQPGVVTAVGPPVVISQSIGSNRVNNFAQPTGMVDADPYTPGIQSQPGIVSAVGPSTVVGNVGNRSSLQQPFNPCSCPWWLWPLLALMLVAPLLGLLYKYMRPSPDDDDDELKCSGYLTKSGKCIACPEGSQWNGKICSYVFNKEAPRRTVNPEQGQLPEGTDLPETITKLESATSVGKSIPVFAEALESPAIQEAFVTANNEGVSPVLITSTPTPSQPSEVIDAANRSVQAGENYVSVNVVDVQPIQSIKRVPATISYSVPVEPVNPAYTNTSGRYVSKFSNTGGSTTTTTTRVTRVTRRRSESSVQGGDTARETERKNQEAQADASRESEIVEPISQAPSSRHLLRRRT